MKTHHHVLRVLSVLSITGCAAGGPAGEPGPESSTTSAQAITLVDCQKQLTTCTLSAKSFTDLAGCTAAYQSCSKQAAADLVQATLLSGCLQKVNSCLGGAVSLSDITACRSVYESCTSSVQGALDVTLKNAVSAAQAEIDKAVQLADSTLNALGGNVTSALGAVLTCDQKAQTCIQGATTLTNLSGCQDAFSTCVNGAVNAAKSAVESVPVPVPTGLTQGLSDCQAQAQTCLTKAITSAGITACQNVLQTCVSGATTAAGLTP